MDTKTLPIAAASDEASHCHGGACCNPHEAPAQAASAPPAADGVQFRIPTMDCSVEEAEIRRALEPIDGIGALGFQLAARTLTIAAPPEVVEAALAAIRRAGFEPSPLPRDAGGEASPQPLLDPGAARLALSLGLAIAAEAIEFFAPHGLAFKAIGMLLALAAIGLAGLETYRKGFAALRRGKLTITALMSVAVTGAFLIGQWPEAAMVMALYAIAELIEAKSVDRARNAIKTLMALAPEQAEVLQPGGSWNTVAAAGLAVGDVVRIRPGGRVPVDGIVTRGASAIDQSPVTGESIPVDKAAGDTVFAGTVNQSGELEVRATVPASGTTLARIIHAVEQAQGARAPTQRFVDRFAALYTPAIFGMAVLAAVLLPWLTGASWTEAVYKALVLLVIACPCALVISTPVTVVSALAAAARHGILVKGGTYLEAAKDLKVVALDKTGTITEGKPKLVHWQALGDAGANDVARLAASLAGRSDHPVSKAIAQGLAQAAREAEPVEAFEAITGRGVQALVGGQRHALGNHRLVEERGLCSPALEQQLQAHERQGRTVTLLLAPDRVLGLFAVADTIKPGSRQAIDELKSLGITPVLLTGDNTATAQSIAQQAGIGEARGNLLPEDKLAAIEDLRRRHGPTAMAGDGINDAPALAQADIGIAMGGAGTDAAMEAADVVVMNDDLRRIPATVWLSRATHGVLWQNISIALGIKGVFFVLALAGSATMWMAVFADMGASLLVVANGLRLLNSRFADAR